MTEDYDLQQPQGPRRGGLKRFLKGLAIVAGVLVVVWVVGRYQIARIGGQKLAAMQVRLEAEQPPWQIEEIELERFRHAPPAGRNSAPVVDSLAEQIPESWRKWRQSAIDSFPVELSNRLPRPQVVERLREQAACTATIRKQAHELRDLPMGYRGFSFPVNPLALSLPHLDSASRVVSFLDYDALLAGIGGDPNRGIRAAHAALNAARSIGDEPTLVSQLFRMSSRNRATQIALQSLAWGTPTTGLTELQTALLGDADENLFLYGIRGERSGLHRLFVALEAGAVSPENAFGPCDRPEITRTALFVAYGPLLYGDHAECLRVMSNYVEAAKLPWPEQRIAIRAVLPNGPSTEVGHTFTRYLLPACDKFVDTALKGRANFLTCAMALACERYRQQTGRWPRNLEEVPKAILPLLPVSPFDGRPLRYRVLPDGIAVSCFCPDEKMNIDGPAEFREPGVRGFAEGARLWNPEVRGLLPLPEKVGDQP